MSADLQISEHILRQMEAIVYLCLVEGLLEYLDFPLLKFFFFNSKVTSFVKYCRAKFREILISGPRESYST